MHALRSARGAGAPARRSRRTPVDAAGLDRDHRLDQCEGFLVDSSDGRLGFVEQIRRRGDSGDAVTLIVRAGRLGKRLLLVPADEVAFVIPRAERIWLHSPVRITATETR